MLGAMSGPAGWRFYVSIKAELQSRFQVQIFEAGGVQALRELQLASLQDVKSFLSDVHPVAFANEITIMTDGKRIVAHGPGEPLPKLIDQSIERLRVEAGRADLILADRDSESLLLHLESWQAAKRLSG
jgi:hypothetical protein